jgi:hypothetical protein
MVSQRASKILAISSRLGNLATAVSVMPRKPLWLIPNLLSLDAPLVALAWLYVFAKTWRVDYHPWQAYASLGLAVWVIYVSDRLLDASMLGASSRPLEARHSVHQAHRKSFTVAAVIAVVVASSLVVSCMSYAIYQYILIGSVVVAGFFGLSMLAAQEVDEIPHTKNILAGIGFAFGTAMMAHVYLPEHGIYHMLISPQFISFGILCTLNISAIDLWEESKRSNNLEVKASAELALTIPLAILAAGCLFFALLDQEMATRPFFYAILTGAALLQILNRLRSRFSMDALRVLADVAMLVPILVYLAAAREVG